MIIDTHSHTNKSHYQNIEDILQKSKLSGVEKIIVPATSLKDSKENQQFGNEMLYYAIGSHPNASALLINKADLENVYTKKIIAIGECGLDYYYSYTDKDIQKKNFRIQIEFAISKNLPLIIHTREALDDTLDIIKDYYKKGDTNKGVIHSAAGDIKILEKIEDCGFYLSFNGISTFRNADNIRDLILHTDENKILIETDSPYLTPEPIRKEKINNSSNIKYILENIEKLKDMDLEDTIYNNSVSLFKI